MAGVTIDTGPIHYRDELKETPREKWTKVFRERRLYIGAEFKYGCRCVINWLAEAEEFHEELGYESADDMLQEELGIEPDWVRMAASVLEATGENLSKVAEYRSAADILFPIRGAWSFDSWQLINTRFWDDSLTPGAILWGLTAGCNFGSYNPNNNAITLHEALPGKDFAKQGEVDWVMANRNQDLKSWGLRPESFGIGTALSTLLHETMHQAHHQLGKRYPPNRKGQTDVHHNHIWLAECERVAALIGITPRLWPFYVERKERADEVRSRLARKHRAVRTEPHPDDLTGAQLNNRRCWIRVPTIDGAEITPDIDDTNGTATYQGQPIASASEITGFPRESFNQQGIKPADRIPLILPKG